MTLRCLFVDFDSYFASVEQYDRPELIDRPVAVVPVAADTTCCLAASYPAKRLGIKTGTSVREARDKCPDIALLLARPARYVEIHHRLMQAIEDCVPHGQADSIDEVPCWLIGRERQRENAVAIARSIKQRLADLGFSPAIRCSIGIAPNRFLAKTASDMHKPDGLTVIEAHDLPHVLHDLQLRDFCGIGRSMEERLMRHGIRSVPQLCAASREQLRRAWGSVEGERFWLQLRGHELPQRRHERASIGHSHVLGPELRTASGMRSVLFKLLTKAAMRLRREGFLASGMAIRVRFVGREERFERALHFAPVDDTPTLLHLLGEGLQPVQPPHDRRTTRRHPPLAVAVTLLGLQAHGAVTGELMAQRPRGKAISQLLDQVNARFGSLALYSGAARQAFDQQAAPMRIPFSTIPDLTTENEAPNTAQGTVLWQQHENRFKALAEQTHRQQAAERRPRPASQPRAQPHTGDLFAAADSGEA